MGKCRRRDDARVSSSRIGQAALKPRNYSAEPLQRLPWRSHSRISVVALQRRGQSQVLKGVTALAMFDRVFHSAGLGLGQFDRSLELEM